MLSLSPFLFKCARHYRDIHSFPTRRSSDLMQRHVVRELADDQVGQQAGPRQALVDGHRRDRKSTRLNSSHLGISYAVFCLKKKKRMRNIVLKIKHYMFNER